MAIEPLLIDNGPAYEASGLVHRVQQTAANGPHPTVVMIHGRAGNEDVMWVFARALPPGWLVVAPRALKDDPDGGYSWHPPQADEWPELPLFDEAVAAVHRFIQALPDLYQADLNRLYLMGFSQGAAVAYATALHHPGLAQGIAGLVGFVPTETDAAVANAPLQMLPVFMAAGREDERIPLNVSQQAAEVMRAAGAEVEYHEYDTGHKLNAQGMRDLKAWWDGRSKS
jgi:phospholipase/carboxylesterase